MVRPSNICNGMRHHSRYIYRWIEVGCAAIFPNFETFVSLPLMASIFTAELCVIFLTLTRISTHNGSSFVIYSDFRSALQPLGKLYTHNVLVLKI